MSHRDISEVIVTGPFTRSSGLYLIFLEEKTVTDLSTSFPEKDQIRMRIPVPRFVYFREYF